MMRAYLSVSIGLLLLAGSTRAWANGPEIGRDAGMVFPLESAAVALDAETVDVRYDFSSRLGAAECVYHLRNLTNSPQVLEMAFLTNSAAGQSGGSHGFYRDLQMSVEIDGERAPVELAPVRPSSWSDLIKPVPDSLPVWKLALAPEASIRVHLTYPAWSRAAVRTVIAEEWASRTTVARRRFGRARWGTR